MRTPTSTAVRVKACCCCRLTVAYGSNRVTSPVTPLIDAKPVRAGAEGIVPLGWEERPHSAVTDSEDTTLKRSKVAGIRIQWLIIAARRGELLAVRWGDVDLATRTLLIRAVEEGAKKTSRRSPVDNSRPSTFIFTTCAMRPAAAGSSKAGRSIMDRRCWGTRTCRRRARTCTHRRWACRSRCAASMPRVAVANQAAIEQPPVSREQADESDKGTLH